MYDRVTAHILQIIRAMYFEGNLKCLYEAKIKLVLFERTVKTKEMLPNTKFEWDKCKTQYWES